MRHCKCCQYFGDDLHTQKILKAESEIAHSLSEFLKYFICELERIQPIEKRVCLMKELLCAYSCKEKAMSELVDSLNIKRW